MDPVTAKLIAGALTIMLPAFGAALGLGMYFSAYAQGVARNPQSKELLDKNFFLILAMIEALGIIPIGIGAALLFG